LGLTGNQLPKEWRMALFYQGQEFYDPYKTYIEYGVLRACFNPKCESHHFPLEMPQYEEAILFYGKPPVQYIEKQGTPHVKFELDGQKYILCHSCASVYGMLKGYL
jgi:hypothetical protein